MQFRHGRPSFPGVRPALVCAFLILALAGGALSPAIRSTSAQSQDTGVQTLSGSLSVDNPLLTAVGSEPDILLSDLTAFVKRDRTLSPSLDSQILAPIEGSVSGGATFKLHLPIAPAGEINDLAHGKGGDGVQVYSVEFNINLWGDPFGGTDELSGWGNALSSMVTEVATGEVTGGQIVVFAPDANEQFPTGFGADKMLFTDDDPVGPIPAGWSVIDLDASPFGIVRDADAAIEITPGDQGFFDYSAMSFTDAFNALLNDLEPRYPFTDLKKIDWDALRAEFGPRVADAEKNNDALAFNEALIDFSLRFNDGHVNASIPPEVIAAQIGGRVGMRLAETDDGQVIAISVTEGLPADTAGIKLGAVISTWNGDPILDAVAKEPLFSPESSDHAKKMQQFEFLTRSAAGDTVSVAFTNPGGTEQSATLTFGADIEGRDYAANTNISIWDVNDGQLPVDAKLLDSGIGYIKLTTFAADPVLMSHAWDLALQTFQQLGAIGLIVDVRDNPGGLGDSATHLAGSFYSEGFDLADTFYNDTNGTPVQEAPQSVTPASVQWTGPVAVVVDDDCASACEIFAAAVAHDPDHLIVGYTPTGGIEASVYFWALPGGISFGAPVGALKNGNEIFLEGSGVAPNVRVPATTENLLDPGDEVLTAAEDAINASLGG